MNSSSSGYEMIFQHCVAMLQNGRSPFQASEFDDYLRVEFKLESGISTRKLNGMKTGLLMIEIMRAQTTRSLAEQQAMFSNFIDYVFENLCETCALALIKYAVSDRKLNIGKVTDLPAWKKVSRLLKPVLLHTPKTPAAQQFTSKFIHSYERFKAMTQVSELMYEFAQTLPAPRTVH